MLWPVTELQQRDAMAKMWAIFPVGSEDPIHLRAIWGRGVPDARPIRNITFNARAYPDVTDRQRAFEDAALQFNAFGYNIYTVFNRIDPSFGGDEHNGQAVSDRHIAARRYLLIDLDRSVATNPATVEEIDEVLEAAFEIEKALFYEKGHEPLTVFSGNGVHVYLPLADLPNNNFSKTQCQQVLLGLARDYGSATVKVDTAVYNAARVTKVPGTIAYKGVETEERYYHMAELVE